MTERRMAFGNCEWRDFYGCSKDELRVLATEYGLNEEMVEDCLDPRHLPKHERSNGVGFLILRAYDENSPDDATVVQDATRKVAIFGGENYVLTFHRVPLKWIDGVWEEWARRATRAPAGLGAMLEDLVEECLFTFEAPIDRAAEAIDLLQDHIFRNDQAPIASRDIVQQAHLAKKRATLFKRILRLTRDIVPSISKIGDPSSSAIQNLKEEADRLFFYADDLVETSSDLVQLSISLASNRTNEVVRILTLVSIFLLPLNLLTGIYGMNFEHMPELHWKYGYPGVLLLMVVVELVIFFEFKRRGWIRQHRAKFEAPTLKP